MNAQTRVILALAAAIVAGGAIAASGSERALQFADAIAPLGTLWINAIRMTVIPLVLALVVTGIASASEVQAIGRLGVRTLGVFLGLLVATAVVMVPLSQFILSQFPDGVRPALPPGAAEAASAVAASGVATSFSTWFASLLPANPIAAAANGAMVPYVLFALVLAVAIANTASESRATLLAFFRALGDAMMTLVRGVIWLAPLGVFALLLPFAAHAGASLAGAIGAYIVIYSLAAIACTLLLYPAVRLAAAIPMSRFARAALPTQLIAFSSSSSIASLPALVESAEVGLALPKKVTGFVVPLATAVFKIAAPVSWTIGPMFVAWFYNLPLPAPQVAIVAFAAVFLGFAAPGIPNGGFIMLAPLLVTVGLPAEGVGLLIALDAIPDRFITIHNVTGNLAATAIVARLSPER